MQHDPDSRVNQIAEARVYPFPGLQSTDLVTRAELLAEGDLIEVPREVWWRAGWRVPVAISRGVYDELVRDPDAVTGKDDGPGRGFTRQEIRHLWWICRAGTFKVATGTALEKDAPEIWVPVDGALLVLHRGPGDRGEPVVTFCTEAER